MITVDQQPSAVEGMTRSIALVCFETSVHAALLSIEPFRAANRMSRAPLFTIDFCAAERRPMRTTLDVTLPVTATFDDPRIYDLVLLQASYEVDRASKATLFRWLRRQAVGGATLAGMDVAPLLIAEAGLLKGFKATSHWSTIASFRELHPETDVVEQLFVNDRNRATCAGQLACLDFSMAMLERYCGRMLRDIVANEIVYTAPRAETAGQRQIINGFAWHTNPILLQAQNLMQENIEEPLSIAAIAKLCGISPRELQHLFKKYLMASPKSYYTTFRLQRAKELLLYSTLSVRETGLAAGFVSSTAYFRAFRARYDTSPLNYRKGFQTMAASPDGRRLY